MYKTIAIYFENLLQSILTNIHKYIKRIRKKYCKKILIKKVLTKRMLIEKVLIKRILAKRILTKKILAKKILIIKIFEIKNNIRQTYFKIEIKKKNKLKN